MSTIPRTLPIVSKIYYAVAALLFGFSAVLLLTHDIQPAVGLYLQHHGDTSKTYVFCSFAILGFFQIVAAVGCLAVIFKPFGYLRVMLALVGLSWSMFAVGQINLPNVLHSELAPLFMSMMLSGPCVIVALVVGRKW